MAFKKLLIFGLVSSLSIVAARAQDAAELAPLPKEWGRMEKALDLSLDQVQGLRVELTAMNAAMAAWAATNQAAADAIRDALSTAQKAGDTGAVATLTARYQPLQASRNAIKQQHETRMADLLRPEQKAAWAIMGRHKNLVEDLLQIPNLTGDQKNQIEAALKAFATSMGQWEAVNTPEAARLMKANDENRAARTAVSQEQPVNVEKRKQLEKEHKSFDEAITALKTEQKTRTDAFLAALIAFLTPEQRTAFYARTFTKDLQSKARKFNPTPDQLAAISTKCEEAASKLGSASLEETVKAREELTRTILEQVIPASQRPPVEAGKPAAPVPPAPAP